MLKNVPPLISPDLMHALMSMGHGDEIVLADGNFPGASNAQRLIRADGHEIAPMLKAIMQFFPLDNYVSPAALVMEVLPDDDVDPVIWNDYCRILADATGKKIALGQMERHEFYERARSAFAIVATGEGALYANLILVKGVVA
ncbi:MAG: RbsD/FucU family protein [Candidatus Brocadiia bacterium]